MLERLSRPGRTAVRAIALAAFLLFLATSFRAGWTQAGTDFPNYYTAAVLVRHREPLPQFYDWTWFQRQMSYAGFERQLGAYTPQTPLTMLPLLPLTQAPPQTAKRLWLAVNLVLLVSVLWILAGMTKTPVEQLALLAFCGYGSLAMNFGLGQYYVFLLFLITLTVYLLRAGSNAASGLLSGITFGLKLYTGPLILYFVARKKWRAAAAMAAGSLTMLLVAIAIFGWTGVSIYLTQVLPRTLEGGSVDPYHPANATFVTLLRRMFVHEPALNPHPLMDAPWLFFGLRTVIRFCLVSVAVLGAAFTRKAEAEDGLLAWFLILLVLLSVSTATYTFILLLTPIALLWPGASTRSRLLLSVCYILLNIPLTPVWLFPKLWLLFFLFFAVGYPYLRSIPPRWSLCAIVMALALGVVDSSREVRLSSQEPNWRYSQLGSKTGAMFSSFATVSKFGLFYQCMGNFSGAAAGRYALCWQHGGGTETLGFPGYVFHPKASTADGSIWFELVAGASTILTNFDPLTRRVTYSPTPAPVWSGGDAVSADGRWVAFTRGVAGSRELWVRAAATGKAERIAGGRCDNGEPVWELDSSAVIFASDCERAYGLPALYRAPAASFHE